MERYTATRENDIIKEIFLHKKIMAQVAREQGLSFDRIRQIKESGLRRLRMGKAKRELLEKFDIAETGLFRGGLNRKCKEIGLYEIRKSRKSEKHIAR